MKKEKIDVSQFSDIKSVYAYIDENGYELKQNGQLINIWCNYREYTKNNHEQKQAQWEVECLMFNLLGGEVFPQVFSSASNNGNITSYPDLNEFHKAKIAYVAERAEQTLSAILKAMYYHLLWKAPNEWKNNDHVKCAIEQYIKAINTICDHNDNRTNYFQIGKLYENLLAAVNSIKVELRPLKMLTQKLLFASSLGRNTKVGILRDMLAYPKLFKSTDFKDTLPIIETNWDAQISKTDLHQLVDIYLPIALKIAAKIKDDDIRFYNKLGDTYVKIAEIEKDPKRFWIKADYFKKALDAFGLARNQPKINHTELLYSQLKHGVTLPSLRTELNEEDQKALRDHHETVKKRAAFLLTENPDRIYRVISEGTFFPKYSDVNRGMPKKEETFSDHFTTIIFDRNKNITKPKEKKTDEEKLFEGYGFYLENSVLPYLHYTFMPGIKSRHLTYENLILFFVNHSWLRESFSKTDLGGEVKVVNWITLISPAIAEFFLQVNAWTASKYYHPSFVLCIDSLSLKFEGLIREFASLIGVATVKLNRKKGMQEKYIHDILDDKKFEEYFNKDDILFFKYLFTDKGFNLRNKVAHSFYAHEEYHPDMMLLILAALLRLAKYDLKVEVK